MPQDNQALPSADAWQISRPGNIVDVLKFNSIQLPKLGPDQVLIKVAYAALNPVDYKLAALMPSFVQKTPRTAATDFSGHVVRLGSDALKTQYPWLGEANAAVFGITRNIPPIKAGLTGALSTYTIANAADIQPVPDSEAATKSGVTLENAAGLGIVAATAAAMAEHVHEGDRVLINGGTSAVGLIAAELARVKGASFVVATGSGAKIQFLKDRGLDDVVDYRATDAKTELAKRYGSQPFDVALDTIGSQELHVHSAAYLKPNARWVNIGASVLKPDSSVFSTTVLSLVTWALRAKLPRFLGGYARALVQLGPDFKDLKFIREQLQAGKIRLVTDSVFEWKQAPEAYRKLIGGRALGKIIVKVEQ
ncbi:hypothetical protein OC861_006453 [Tilletia horrida]|nr:hypothetical protein OC861_006453 [Tilletia horrida]